MEQIIVKGAIKSLQEGGFNCMPMPEYRDKAYEFASETHKMVKEAGFRLKWLDTFKGGCWHLIPA